MKLHLAVVCLLLGLQQVPPRPAFKSGVTLVGTTVRLDRTNAAAAEYAGRSGKVYRVALPKPLAPGAYRLVVETSLGSTQVSREVVFRVSSP